MELKVRGSRVEVQDEDRLSDRAHSGSERFMFRSRLFSIIGYS